MTAEEVVKLCRYIKAACPNQQFDEYTAEVWAEVIPQWLTLGEARQAVIAIKQRQPYVDISDVIAEARRARRPAEDQRHLRILLDKDLYREEIEKADAHCLKLIEAHQAKLLAIEGPPKPPPVYIGPRSQGHWMHPQDLARLQAAESRAEREAS